MLPDSHLLLPERIANHQKQACHQSIRGRKRDFLVERLPKERTTVFTNACAPGRKKSVILLDPDEPMDESTGMVNPLTMPPPPPSTPPPSPPPPDNRTRSQHSYAARKRDEAVGGEGYGSTTVAFCCLGVQEVNMQLTCGYQKADHTVPPQSPG
ncbi:uncharacterized protein LOC144907370 [Branchiostoma floridae x Branchiostoma belcheri]